MVNYNPATACVLLGCAAAGADLQSDLVRRGVRFLVAHQNTDGGWGEDTASYADPSKAGIGPSNPPLTGLVVNALVSVGEGGSDAVERGVAYLVGAQRSDGTWSNGDWLHAYLPPANFYYLPGEPRHYTLEALGRYLAFAAGRDVTHAGDENKASMLRAEAPDDAPIPSVPVRLPGGGWNPAFLDAMRQVGDPLADGVIQQVFADGNLGAVNQVLAQISCSDDPIPPG